MKLLLGSNNENKYKEIGNMLLQKYSDSFQLLTPGMIETYPLSPEETGKSLEANALLKAEYFFDKYSIPCFADDTGLEIEALNGEPGVHSARYAGTESNDAKNRKLVIEKLIDLELLESPAKFRTVFCFFDGKDIEYIVGICPGKIINIERGDYGFGYDPLFIPEGYDCTFAEMTMSEKNAISHRAKATEKLIKFLGKRFNL